MECARDSKGYYTDSHSCSFVNSCILRHSQVVSRSHKMQEACQRIPECKNRAKFPYAILMPTSRGWGILEGRGRADALLYYYSTR